MVRARWRAALQGGGGSGSDAPEAWSSVNTSLYQTPPGVTKQSVTHRHTTKTQFFLTLFTLPLQILVRVVLGGGGDSIIQLTKCH